MRVLITGAKGQLGQDLIKVFSNTANQIIGYDIDELDLTNFAAVQEEIQKLKPDTVIHPAAYTNVDGCETDHEGAFKVNGVGTANLAMACEKINAQMLYISTDYVFDGLSKEPYTEFDNVNPLSIYGKSKLAGERAVMSLTNRWYIARTAWLYGHGGANFVKTIQKAAKEKGELKVVNDQQGSPTYTMDLANKVLEIVTSGQYGTYHVTNSGSCTWYDFAIEIINLSGIDAKISPCSTDEFPRPAKRPANSVLSNYNLHLRGFEPMRHWKDALEDYLKGC